MNADDNPLDFVWATFKTTRDCLKVADKVRTQANVNWLQKTDFIFLSETEASERLKTCHDESENFAILLFWAVFERFIIDYLREKGKPLMEIEPNALSGPFYQQFESTVEYWRIEDILDIFKSIVDPNLLGNAKNIKKYRDWVAHRNPRRVHEGKTDPRFVYSILSQIITAINNFETSPDSL
jgi:hypothetical protein